MHQMKLQQNPFDLIKSGEKTIEVRLYDDKRQLIAVGDTIEFSKLPELTETINVVVEALLIYKDFKSLFTDFDANKFGGKGWSIDALVENMHTYYSVEDEQKFGVLGIKVRVI